MSVQPPTDLLKILRTNLRRIDEEHRDEELSPAVLEFRQLLLRRIATIEAAIKSLNEFIANTSARNEPDRQ